MMNSPTPDAPIQVHQFHALAPGPRLIVLGAVHGNETCGTQGIQAVMKRFEQGTLRLIRGSLTLVPITNPLAYAKATREGERNLNRDFRPAVVVEQNEDRIANVLAPLLQQHDALLDLHSFTSQGEPFVFLGPPNNSGPLEPFGLAAQEEALAQAMGLKRVVFGWLEAFAQGVARRNAAGVTGSLINTHIAYGIGTTEYMRSVGGYAITVECGNHADPQAPAIAEQSILRALAHLGLVDKPAPLTLTNEVLELVEVQDRAHIGDYFSQPWQSFDRVTAGELIGTRADGKPLHVQHNGCIVFPNANAALGREWFYLARDSDRLTRP
jgi:uncharacterized protein